MADKKISQLDLAAQINNDAVIPMSQENGGEETTYKALITALGAKIAEGLTFSNLATTAKNLVGAINEIQAGGGGGGAAILIGTTTPSSSQGSNGNLYIKYTEGVGGADDTVDAIYVKLDGTWCEVTTDYADLLNKPSINNTTLSGNKTNNDLGIYGKTIEMSTTDPDSVADRIEDLEKANDSSLLYKPTVTEPTLTTGDNHNHRTYYYKHNTKVCLSIGVKNLSTGLMTQSLFTLPSGYRPRYSLSMACCGYSFDKISSVQILDNGGVVVQYTQDQGCFGYIEFDAYS